MSALGSLNFRETNIVAKYKKRGFLVIQCHHHWARGGQVQIDAVLEGMNLMHPRSITFLLQA